MSKFERLQPIDLSQDAVSIDNQVSEINFNDLLNQKVEDTSYSSGSKKKKKKNCKKKKK